MLPRVLRADLDARARPGPPRGGVGRRGQRDARAGRPREAVPLVANIVDLSAYTHAQRAKLPPFYDYSRARFFARARKDRGDDAFVFLDEALAARGLSSARLPRGGVVFASDESALKKWDLRLARLVAEEPAAIVVGGDNPVSVDAATLELHVVKRKRGVAVRVPLPLPLGCGLFAQNLDAAPARAQDSAVAAARRSGGAVRQMPLSVKRRFVDAVRRREVAGTGGRRERAGTGDSRALLGCCCMYDRNGRGTRAGAYRERGLCLNWRGDLKSCCMPPAMYLGHMLAKVVWSPHGAGLTNYRDLEALYSGAAVLLDNKAGLAGHPGSPDPAAFHYLSRAVPAIWLQGHAQKRAWVDDTNVTKGWLARQFQNILDREAELDVAEIYWPYWLYHITRPMAPLE